jgi:uncharacterized cupredoxin-like copper-binding protein
MRRIYVTSCMGSLLGFLLGAAAAAAATQPVEVDVVMVDYRFEPDHLTFDRGVHYRLHLENRGKETHEFTAPTFFAASAIDNPDVLNAEQAEVLLQPGDKKDVLLTPLAAGTYDLRCADHDWYGMVGGITVH